MNGTKSTKRALVSSAMAILLCLAMLIGTTFAWFTDSASTAVNKIQAGTLDVALEMATSWSGGTPIDWGTAEGQTLRWMTADGRGEDLILWEPGCTYNLNQFRIVNKGNLALKYKIIITGIVGDAELLEAIDFTVTGVDGAATAAALNGFEGKLAANSVTDAITITGHMKEEAGNEYQGKSIDGIAITVVATQDTVEYDSTTNQYDRNSAFPTRMDSNVTDNGNTVLQDKAVDYNIKLTAPVNSLGADVAKLTLIVEDGAVPAGITVESTEKCQSYEMTLNDQNGTAVSSTGDTLFEVEMMIGKNRNDVRVYHSGALMTDDGETLTNVADHYVYNSTTGYVTMKLSHFSPITAVYSRANWIDYAAEEYASENGKNIEIATAEQLALFAKKTRAGTSYAGYTVKLTDDIDLMGDSFAWMPINGFTGTFDGDDHTISNLWVHGGEDGKGFGLFGSSNAKAVKNLNIHNAYVYGNSAVAAVLGSSNAIVTNVHVDGLIQIGTTTHNGHIANFNSSYIGGIVGYGYAKVSDCSVRGEEGSLIGGGRQVGGIIGFGGEGKSDRASNCTVENVKLTGTRCVGGIIGWAHYGNNVKNCTVNNVDLEVTGTETNTIGLITGTSYTYPGNNYDEFVGNTATNCTMTVDGKLHSASAPFDMYATYASGECYIKRGDNTYIYCETEEQANTIKQDGDIIISMVQ